MFEDVRVFEGGFCCALGWIPRGIKNVEFSWVFVLEKSCAVIQWHLSCTSWWNCCNRAAFSRKMFTQLPHWAVVCSGGATAFAIPSSPMTSWVSSTNGRPTPQVFGWCSQLQRGRCKFACSRLRLQECCVWTVALRIFLENYCICLDFFPVVGPFECQECLLRFSWWRRCWWNVLGLAAIRWRAWRAWVLYKCMRPCESKRARVCGCVGHACACFPSSFCLPKFDSGIFFSCPPSKAALFANPTRLPCKWLGLRRRTTRAGLSMPANWRVSREDIWSLFVPFHDFVKGGTLFRQACEHV